MSGKTITRAQLGEFVYQEVGLSRNESAELLETVLNQMSEALARGETVKVSSFGSFSVDFSLTVGPELTLVTDLVLSIMIGPNRPFAGFGGLVSFGFFTSIDF